ncbi:hypothetical protein NPIL_240891 [Nephila pilipes]|uniref:Uncharacterized protein n=1 Tax=Nephila pilipes TaxID=299642 RepID=A0A8X6MWL9_NEPPI|nr:hypothetical protein NPIL_240891 [Nephila pilipes]
MAQNTIETINRLDVDTLEQSPNRSRSLSLSYLWTNQGSFERFLRHGHSGSGAKVVSRPTEKLLPGRHTEACGSLDQVHCSRWRLYGK